VVVWSGVTDDWPRISRALDLRDVTNQEAVGLALDDLLRPTSQHVRCQRIGRVAHQLALHGIIAPAATGLGETLAVFELHLTPEEQPVLVDEEEWPHLPPDPRAPRAVEEESAQLD
jgi:hypothetical protein